jgi:hypothetical protein
LTGIEGRRTVREMRTGAVRALLAAGAAGGSLAAFGFLEATPAAAHVTPAGSCDGSGTINGKTYTPANDTPGNPVHLPDKGTVHYQGHTATLTKPHHGHIDVVIGPAKVTIYSWASANDGNKLASTGDKDLKKAYDKLPIGIAGLYKITGEHFNGNTLYCSGWAYVKFDKSPLSTPIGAGALGATVLTGIGVVGAAFGKKVVA